MTDIRALLVSTFGLGYLRPAPGTWGSMPPVLLAGAMIELGAGPVQRPILYNAVMLAIAVLFTAICIAFGTYAERRFGRKDPSHVVADETAGQAIVLMFLPAAAVGGGRPVLWFTLGACFVAFRLFDIVKLPPAYRLQRLRGGWGIVIDDLFAGLYALAAVQAGALAAGILLA